MSYRKPLVSSLVIAALLLAACGRAAPASPAAAPSNAGGTAPTSAPAPRAAGSDRTAAEFYRGKTIRMVVGFAAGGSYDLATRRVARS